MILWMGLKVKGFVMLWHKFLNNTSQSTKHTSAEVMYSIFNDTKKKETSANGMKILLWCCWIGDDLENYKKYFYTVCVLP